ncbi:DUF5696 domain-containing protein [Paenibacillus sp. 1001270B_150601_E10]|uniref:DUF5696 domain-containing protein n=1 Tax=Paenibacillus sp. 1001270B_150601_E10 TaxID=2787079 RepID=UPI00189FB170|nr:DUF5696 domain-containing protein [Paenibacillus sp. 1001270B_150601_E10]
MRKSKIGAVLLCCGLILTVGINEGLTGTAIMAYEKAGTGDWTAHRAKLAAIPELTAETRKQGEGDSSAAAVESPAAKAISPAQPKAGEVAAASIPFDPPQGMVKAAENTYLQLFHNRKTTEILVRDKRTGELWSSNPADRDQDKIAKATNKSDLDSQFILSYYNDRGHEAMMNNAAESVQKGQFEIKEIDGGVKIIYEIGSSEEGLGAIPKVISKERFEERILNQIEDESARGRLRSRFFFNEEKQQYERKEMQDYIVKDVAAILESIGYTAEEAMQDSASANGDSSIKESAAPRFTIPIRYELDDEQLLVSIDTEEVQDTEAFPLHTIQLLPFFGAAGLQEEGYMFVPDGSGALIELNQDHIGARAYELPLYGEDATPIANTQIQLQPTETSRLPVFGLKRGEQAMLAIVEAGDAQASIMADISGRLNSYNRVNASFRMKDMESVQFRAGSVTRHIPKYSEMYNQGIAVRYGFLHGDEANYVGMARLYREHLIESQQLTPIQDTGDLPFILELVGGIPVRKTFLGIPYESVESVTTYREATAILEQLQQKGVQHIQLKYSGWFNEGYYHTLPTRVKPDSILGGTKGLQSLIQFARERQIELYPDVAFQEVYENGKGFKAQRDGARFLNRKGASRTATDLVTTNPGERLYYLLAPDKLRGIVDAFVNSYRPLELPSVSLRDLGDELNSSVSPQVTTTRQEALAMASDSLNVMNAEIGDLMISGGNAYALPYAKTIVHAPLSSSRFNIESEEIPFYSIVLHGYIDHAGKPINMERDQDPRTSLLKTLETGTLPFYQWFYEKPSAVRDTKLSHLYSASYENWIDEAAELYQEANSLLQQVRNQPITGHRKLLDKVYETTFDKGLRIIVNYNREAVTVDGMSIEALGYRAAGGGA